MNKLVSFPIAKLLKEKGFDKECEFFYSKHGSFNYLKPHREYEHLHSYSNQLVSYFDGKYNWNSLDVDEGMIALKTAFSESDEYVNCECSAPTIADVVMWLYEKYGIWIWVGCRELENSTNRTIFIPQGRTIPSTKKDGFVVDIIPYTPKDSPIEAYEAAIEYTLNNLI